MNLDVITFFIAAFWLLAVLGFIAVAYVPEHALFLLITAVLCMATGLALCVYADRLIYQ